MTADHIQDPRSQLPRDAYFHLIHTLRAALPPGDGTPETIALRDRAAIAQAAALCPANAAEAALAAQFVAANLQAMDCLRLAQDPAAPRDQASRCTAQAGSMMRQAQGAIRLLLRLQRERTRREATEGSVSQAAWIEHCATGWMLEGLRESQPKRQRPTDQTFETITRPPAEEPAAPTNEPEAIESPLMGQNIVDDSFETNVRQVSTSLQAEPDQPARRRVQRDKHQSSGPPRGTRHRTPMPVRSDSGPGARAMAGAKGP